MQIFYLNLENFCSGRTEISQRKKISREVKVIKLKSLQNIKAKTSIQDSFLYN